MRLHTRAYVGSSPTDICVECEITLSPNYECEDCTWEVIPSLLGHSVVEACVQLCRLHVLDYPEPVRIRN